jgi:peroxin-13
MIDQIVQAFGGFAQMLESTFFATHSSFMAMVGVAEQMGHLRSYLGQVLSAITVLSFIKKWAYRLMGRNAPVDLKGLNLEEFEKFSGKGAAGAAQSMIMGPNGQMIPAPGRGGKSSRRPVLLFFLFMFGFPWLMSKLIQRLQKQRLEAATPAAGAPGAVNGASGTKPGIQGPDGVPLQPSQIKDLEFCRALYDFTGESPAELTFKKGDIIAVLSKADPVTKQSSMWWRGRLRSGPIGHFPSNYVEIIEKKGNSDASPSLPATNNAAPATQSSNSNDNENDQIIPYDIPSAPISSSDARTVFAENDFANAFSNGF